MIAPANSPADPARFFLSAILWVALIALIIATAVQWGQAISLSMQSVITTNPVGDVFAGGKYNSALSEAKEQAARNRSELLIRSREHARAGVPWALTATAVAGSLLIARLLSRILSRLEAGWVLNQPEPAKEPAQASAT